MENKNTRIYGAIMVIAFILFISFQLYKGRPIEAWFFKANHITLDTAKAKKDTPIVNRNTEINIKENKGDIIINNK